MTSDIKSSLDFWSVEVKVTKQIFFVYERN